MILKRVLFPHSYFVVDTGNATLTFNVKSSLVALGGVLDVNNPNWALIHYRLGKGAKCVYKYSKQLYGKQPVGLKLAAFAGSPRCSASFLMAICHWNKQLLNELVRWE